MPSRSEYGKRSGMQSRPIASVNRTPINIAAAALMKVAPGMTRVIRTSTVTIAASGRLDLTDNKLIVSGGNVGAVSDLVARAYGYGAWDGDGLTTSAADPQSGLNTLAVAPAEAIGYDGGVFGGVPVSAGDILVMYTYAGDLNLDGLVDAGDYGTIDNWVQFPGSNAYFNGDINYDGVIDAADYGIIDNTIQLQGPPIPA